MFRLFALKMQFKFTLVACLLCFNTSSQAQEPDFQQWNHLTVDANLDSYAQGLRASLDLQARRMNAPLSCTQSGCEQNPNTMIMVRPSIGYSLTPAATFSLGYAWSPFYFDNPSERATRNIQEHRIWEQYSGRWTKEKLDFSVRLRLEHRIRTDGPGDEQWAHRFRQQMRLTYKLSQDLPWMLIVYDEIFFHLNETNYRTESGFDQNRMFAGLGYQANLRSRFELGYLYQRVHRYTDEHQNNHVLMILGNFAVHPGANE